MILCQQNHLWADKHLGLSTLKIGPYGCTTCCIAMINNRFGANCTPDEVAAHTDWYTRQGLILWNKLHLKNAIFDWREYGLNLVRIKQYLSDPNKAVMIEVQLPHEKKHWMLVDYEDPKILEHFWCDDPWSGIQTISSHYGPVTGAAFFNKRILSLP